MPRLACSACRFETSSAPATRERSVMSSMASRILLARGLSPRILVAFSSSLTTPDHWEHGLDHVTLDRGQSAPHIVDEGAQARIYGSSLVQEGETPPDRPAASVANAS